MPDTVEYKKLPGKGLKKGGTALIFRTRARLYMADDHLLCLYSTGYTENYRRFYFRDIQGIVAARTTTGRTRNIILTLLAAAFGIPAIVFFDLSPFPVFLSVMTVIFILSLFINILQGPTSRCYLVTAVSIEELPSLCRIRNALKVMDILKPVIEQVQGKLAADEIKEYGELPARVFPDTKRDARGPKRIRSAKKSSG